MSKDSQKCSYCRKIKLLENFSLIKEGKYYKTCDYCRTKYKCHICEYTCHKPCKLQYHIKATHDKIKDIQCSICEDKFSTKGNLQRHVKAKHYKIKNYQCSICEYKCSQIGNLQQHVKFRHEQIKDYQCSICEDKFYTSNSLKRHIKATHDKIKDFQCSICEDKFSTKSNLKQHIEAKHYQIRNFNCFKCNFNSFKKSDLERHQKICTGKETMSSGEYRVKKVLESLNVIYQREVPEIKTEKSYLRFDFKIKVNNFTKYIEFDGEQHYEPVCFGGMSPEKAQENFEKLQLHDQMKNEWCKENNHELLRIKYTEFDSVDSLVKEFVNYSIN